MATKNVIRKSPFFKEAHTISLNRADRPRNNKLRNGLSLEESISLLETEPVPPNSKEFRGLPLISTKSPFQSGYEKDTAAEYAVVVDGKLIVHDFNEKPPWPRTVNWEMACIDSKWPVLDTLTVDGTVYTAASRNLDGPDLESDAKGKDLLVILSRFHFVSPLFIDYKHLVRIERAMTDRLFTDKVFNEDEPIMYVVHGQNGLGMPVKYHFHAKCPLTERVAGLIRESGEKSALLNNIQSIIENGEGGIYVEQPSFSGNSLSHPHSRLFGLTDLPMKDLNSYERQQETSRRLRVQSISDAFVNNEKGRKYVVYDGRYFLMVVDPAPLFAGEAVIISKGKYNVQQMDAKEELEELAYLKKMGQCVIDAYWGHIPYNTFTVQTFRDNIENFPETRYLYFIAPMTSMPACLGLATRIRCTTSDPEKVASDYRELVPRINGLIEKHPTHKP